MASGDGSYGQGSAHEAVHGGFLFHQ